MAVVHAVLSAIVPLYESICFFVMRNRDFNPEMEPTASAEFRPQTAAPEQEHAVESFGAGEAAVSPESENNSENTPDTQDTQPSETDEGKQEHNI